jgi:hypothetical protein
MSETAAATANATATNGANVPVTAMSCIVPQGPGWTALVIGTNRPNWSNLNVNGQTPFWWLVVVDLTNLNVVANVLADGVNVPSAIQPYLNNPQYFLFCLSNCQTGAEIPYGAFYTFLQQVGGGPQLAQLEQVYNQLQSGIIQSYSYSLAATMDSTDYPGFEKLSFTNSTVLAMQFMPVTVGGQTIYAPVDPFAA